MHPKISKIIIAGLLFCLALILPAQATITVRLVPTSVLANDILTVDFTPTLAGDISAVINFSVVQGLSAQIFRPGQSDKPVAEHTGSFPQTLRTTVSDTDVGKTWTLRLKNSTNQVLNGRIEVTFPKRFCKDAVDEFKFKMSYEIGSELEDYHCQMLLNILHSLYRPQLRNLREIRAVSPDPSLLGTYSSSLVTLFGLSASRSFALVAYHEIGHLVHLSTSTRDQFDRWKKLYDQSGRDPDNFVVDPIDRSLYGMTNQYEDYAVTYSAYVANTQDTIQEALNRNIANRPLPLEKLKLIMEYFKFTENNQVKVYIYRVGFDIPIPKIERATVPLTTEGVPDFSGEIKWETF